MKILKDIKDWKECINEVVCGDSLAIMKMIPDNAIDLCLTDPPYGIGIDKIQSERGNTRGFGKNAGSYKKYHEQDWDNKIPANEFFDEIKRISKNWIIFGGNYFPYLEDSGVIIWNKGGSGKFKEGELAKTNINTFKIFYFSRSDAYINQLDTVVKVHPTQKPLELMRWCLENYAKDCKTVIDPFAGSFTTARACKDMNFDWIAIDQEKKYCEIGESRLRQENLF